MASGPARTGAATQHQPFNSALCSEIMKKAYCIILAVLAFPVFAENEKEVRGVLSWTNSHFAVVTECTTGTKYRFGVMASVTYFKFTRKAEKLSSKGTVLVTVQGKVTRKLLISSPKVIKLELGKC